MSLSSTGFGRSQTSLLVFSCVVLAIKFLDITKFAIVELGPNSDKNLAVGAISTVVILFLLVGIIAVSGEIVERYIDDGHIGSPKVPDFSEEGNVVHPILVKLKFLSGYSLFFLLKIVPIIVGIMALVLVRTDIFYFFRKIWGLLYTGGQT